MPLPLSTTSAALQHQRERAIILRIRVHRHVRNTVKTPPRVTEHVSAVEPGIAQAQCPRPSWTSRQQPGRPQPRQTAPEEKYDAQPQRTRSSSKARQCARNLHPAPGPRCTHHKLAASSSPQHSKFATRSRHALKCSSPHCSRFVTRSDCF